MAQTFGIDRQPTQLDYASPTQFKFSIVQLPKVEFFTTACNLPSITLADAIFPTPEFREEESVTPIAKRGISSDIGDVKPPTNKRGLFGDATLTILSNKNNPLLEVRFRDVYPASLSGLDYNQNATDVEYLTATCDFKYTLYDIVTL